MHPRATAIALSVAAGVTLPLVASPATAATNATVTVVHGVPATNVDVYVNGKATLRNFRFKTVTNPLSLPAGTYHLAVRPAGAAASSRPILAARQRLAGGQNATIVAHLTAGGSPKLTAFGNPTAAPGEGRARLVVRHVAAAPAVDVRADGKVVVRGLTNPQQRALTVPAGTVRAAVTLPNSTDPVIGPVALDLRAGRTTIVYAIGSAKGKTLTAVTQTYPSGRSGHAAPAGSVRTAAETATRG